jgi:hypothetical protein
MEKNKINFYVQITIDQSAPEGMTITTDKNLFGLIDTEVVGNTLHLDKKRDSTLTESNYYYWCTKHSSGRNRHT